MDKSSPSLEEESRTTNGEDTSNLLNNNVSFSKLQISGIDETECSIMSAANISVTLTSPERAQLECLSKERQGHADMHKSSYQSADLSITGDCTETNLTVTAGSAEQPELLDEGVEEDYYADGTTQIELRQNDFLQYPLMEVGRRLWQSSLEAQHYTKGCCWSPDGTCILVPVFLDGMHVIELPQDLYTMEAVSGERAVSELKSAVHVKEGGTVYDATWYPFMNSAAPETCCWLASRQHEPIHMWDAFNGELRCTYRGYDEVDEVESAISVLFSNDGEKVMGGYKKAIRIFDTNVPGRNCTSIAVKQAVSCFAVTTDNDSTVTTGSWNGYINHYDLRAPKLGSLFTLGGHTGGITWLHYAATSDSWLLFSGARKDNKILAWDMRNYSQPMREFRRVVDTNQRIHFDIDPQQRWLVSGGTDGVIRAWDLCQDASDAVELPVHTDCCNGINFHPSRPILATSAGQYHFLNDPMEGPDPERVVETVVDYENSLVLLWFSKNGSPP